MIIILRTKLYFDKIFEFFVGFTVLEEHTFYLVKLGWFWGVKVPNYCLTNKKWFKTWKKFGRKLSLKEFFTKKVLKVNKQNPVIYRRNLARKCYF